MRKYFKQIKYELNSSKIIRVTFLTFCVKFIEIYRENSRNVTKVIAAPFENQLR